MSEFKIGKFHSACHDGNILKIKKYIENKCIDPNLKGKITFSSGDKYYCPIFYIIIHFICTRDTIDPVYIECLEYLFLKGASLDEKMIHTTNHFKNTSIRNFILFKFPQEKFTIIFQLFENVEQTLMIKEPEEYF